MEISDVDFDHRGNSYVKRSKLLSVAPQCVDAMMPLNRNQIKSILRSFHSEWKVSRSNHSLILKLVVAARDSILSKIPHLKGDLAAATLEAAEIENYLEEQSKRLVENTSAGNVRVVDYRAKKKNENPPEGGG